MLRFFRRYRRSSTTHLATAKTRAAQAAMDGSTPFARVTKYAATAIPAAWRQVARATAETSFVNWVVIASSLVVLCPHVPHPLLWALIGIEAVLVVALVEQECRTTAGEG